MKGERRCDGVGKPGFQSRNPLVTVDAGTGPVRNLNEPDNELVFRCAFHRH